MDRDGLREAMRGFPVFAGLSGEQLDRLAAQATVTRIPKKGLFFTEARAAQGMHLLLSGKVKLFRMSEEGKEQTIFVFGPGEPFCLCSSFSDGVLPANLAALEDSEVLVLDPDRFGAMVAEDPSVLLNMMKVMARRLKEAMDMIDSLSLKQIPSRLAAYFLSREREGRVELDISYRELAKIIGVTPEALSRALRRMAEDGLVDVNGAEIVLLDREALAAC